MCQWLETLRTILKAGIITGNAHIWSHCFHCPHDLSPYPSTNTHTSSFLPWLFPLPLDHLKNSALFPEVSEDTSSVNPSLVTPWRVQKLLPCPLSTLYLCLSERGVRAWKTWTDISIHQLIAWFIPFLYIKLERLRTPCIFLPEKAEGLVMRPVSQYFRQGNSPLNSFGNQLLEEDLQMFLALWEYKEKSLQWENEVNTEIETLCCLKSCFLRNLDLEQMFAKSCSAMTAGKWWTIPGQSKEDMKRQGMCSAYSHAADAWAMFRKSIKKSLWLQ